MIHYHGTPVGGKQEEAVRFLRGRHAIVSYAHPEDIAIVADICESFILDNGAYSFWRIGKEVDWDGYVTWVKEWSRHPSYDWAIIPDVIGGTEDDNLSLVARYNGKIPNGVPVYHLHESLEYAKWLSSFPRVALGSSGNYATPGTKEWWSRMEDVLAVMCDENGRPKTKLHGLRMLNPDLFSIPFSSADPTNAVRNASSTSRFGTYLSPNRGVRCEVIASIIEAFNSSPVWVGRKQSILELC